MSSFQKKYKSLGEIGYGSYGWVEKAITSDQKYVAIKHIKFSEEEKGVPTTALREMSILKTLNNHSSLVKLREIDYTFQEKSLKLVFDYYQYNLKQFLEYRDYSIPEDSIKLILKQILEGLAFCHERKIIHRDLKPENILVNIDGNIKIADFGLSRVCNFKDNCLTPKIQTLNYRAPEILLGLNTYDSSIDIWTVGCIFAQLFTGKPLFGGHSEIQQIFKIFEMLGTPKEEYWKNVVDLPHFKSTFPKWNSKPLNQSITGVPEIGLSLLEKMLELNPEKRISAAQALEHQYLKESEHNTSISTQMSDQT